MAEYIEREAAITKIREEGVYGSGYSNQEREDNVVDMIESIPAADVRPVVLCRDCKHSDTFAPDCTEATFPLKCLSIRYGGVYPNWFCEHGEKREET